MSFTHPLAKKAKVWPCVVADGGEQRVLVIITSLPLDSNDEHYKQKLVDRLSEAARSYLAESGEAAGYMLMNRAKDWKASS